MKTVALTLMLVIVVFDVSTAFGQTQAVIMNRTGYSDCYFDEMLAGTDVVLEFRFVNTSGSNCSYFPACAWAIESPNGALWGTTTLEVVGTLASSDYTIVNRSVTGSGADTVGVMFSSTGGSGPLVDGFDEVALRITIHPPWDSWFKWIAIRALDSIPGADVEWKWTGAEGCSDVVPEWRPEDETWSINVPRYYELTAIPNCGMPEWAPPTPDTVYGSYCEDLAATFYIDPLSCMGAEVEYVLESGPGTLNPHSGVWTWSGASYNDVGTPLILTVEAWGYQLRAAFRYGDSH